MLQKTSKSALLILTAATSALMLDACSRPNSFPTGYVYHEKEFKSPNPPKSKRFTEAQRSTMSAEQAEQFRLAIYDLVENLTQRAGMPPKAIYVLKPDSKSPFYANVDNDLRESLRHMGYRLADKPEGAYVFTYKADIIEPPKDQTPAPDAPNVTVSLQVYDKLGEGSKMLTEEKGDYLITGAEKMAKPYALFSGVPYKQ